MKKTITLIVIAVLLIAGAILFQQEIQHGAQWLASKIEVPNWADIVSASAAVIALLLGLFTYINWKQGKIREDAYNSIREYIRLFSTIEAITTNSYYKLSGIVPQEGSLVTTPNEASTVLKESEIQFSEINDLFQQLHFAQDEIRFWGVTMTPTAVKLHESMAHRINNYLTCHYTTMNNAGNYYGNVVTLDRLLNEFKALTNNHNKLRLIFEERKQNTIKTLFKF
jgi:hypothetical protein